MDAPAFQFYANDFLAGSAELSLAATGLLIRALSRQWVGGSLPADPQTLMRLLIITEAEFTPAWGGNKASLSGIRGGRPPAKSST